MRVIFTAPIVIFMALMFFFLNPNGSDSVGDGFTPVKISYNELGKYQQKQVDCLAQNIYHEARSEPEQGKQAVAFVTLNRTQNEKFPSDICGVVKQKSRSVCQFSWFCSKVKLDRSSEAFKDALETALFVYANYERLYDVTQGALFYHADYVNPRWRGLEKTTKIGRHIFYNFREGNSI